MAIATQKRNDISSAGPQVDDDLRELLDALVKLQVSEAIATADDPDFVRIELHRTSQEHERGERYHHAGRYASSKECTENGRNNKVQRFAQKGYDAALQLWFSPSRRVSMTIHRLLPNAKQVLRARDFTMLPLVLKEWTPNDLADLMTDLPTSDQLSVLQHLPRSQAVAAFQYLPTTTQEG